MDQCCWQSFDDDDDDEDDDDDDEGLQRTKNRPLIPPKMISSNVQRNYGFMLVLCINYINYIALTTTSNNNNNNNNNNNKRPKRVKSENKIIIALVTKANVSSEILTN